MKVIVIDEWIPWPLESGKKIRSYNLISRLSRKHEIIYIAYVNVPSELSKLEVMEKLGIKVIPVTDDRTVKWTAKFYLEVLANFLSKEPFSTMYHIKQVFIDTLIKAIQDERPDLIHCEWTNLSPFLKYVKGLPVVISSHNIESDIWRRFGEHGSNIFKRFLGYSQARKIERLERYWYPKADMCIAVSPEDKRVMESYGAKVDLVDNGVDISYYSSFPEAEIDDNAIIFTASFDTFSNQDGAVYFAKEIYPLIKRERPEIQLWLVGKDPSDEIRSFANEDQSIHVTGTVDDVRSYISRAALCVVPLRIGGGSRLKILEAFALKKAVVSTSIGAEGLSVTHGKDILLADTPEAFSRYVVGLLSDREQRKAMGGEGYSLVKEKYDWGPLADIHDNTWKKASSLPIYRK